MQSKSVSFIAALSDSVGLPVGVQIIAKPYHEEVCSVIMCDLYEKFKSRVPRPSSID